MARQLRITVDHTICVGSGTCLMMAPRVFIHNANRQSEVANPTGDPPERILAAAENCPVAAITVEDLETNERLFP